MRTLPTGIGLIALALGAGCAGTQDRREQNGGFAMHSCSKNPFLRSVGLFGGEQPEIFLAGPNLRRETPPAGDESTRVLNVSGVDNLRDPSARPVIDRCASWLESTHKGDIEVTILWRDQNCHDSFDYEDPEHCHLRSRFGFSPKELGVREVLDSSEDPNAALRRLLVVDAYFTREQRPEGRDPATGVLRVPAGDVYLVVRLTRVPRATALRAAASEDAGGTRMDEP